jgi:hypothetical protein
MNTPSYLTVELLERAKKEVRSSPLWKRFIDGTPLENDVACWMADFAGQVRHEHTEAVKEFLNELYAVMVDPCAEGSIKVSDMKAALLAAALESREKLLYELASQRAEHAPLHWQPIESAPRDGRWFWVRRDNPPIDAHIVESAFKWDARYKGWFAGTGWWGKGQLGTMRFTHWREMSDQPGVERLRASGAAICARCNGRGWVMASEHHDLGGGLSSGGSWNEPCPVCALRAAPPPEQP